MIVVHKIYISRAYFGAYVYLFKPERRKSGMETNITGRSRLFKHFGDKRYEQWSSTPYTMVSGQLNLYICGFTKSRLFPGAFHIHGNTCAEKEYTYTQTYKYIYLSILYCIGSYFRERGYEIFRKKTFTWDAENALAVHISTILKFYNSKVNTKYV